MYHTFFCLFRVLILSKGKDPFKAWEALSGSGLEISELAELAITILEIVCNTAGTEQLFSNLKIQQTDHHARMKIAKLEKKAKVRVHLNCYSSHSLYSNFKVREQIAKDCNNTSKRPDSRKRHNHQANNTLLAVPCYDNLLGDQNNEDETECG